MSNKTLLSEAQIRQFMKLAKLEPLTPGFVHGLGESHGRGKGENPPHSRLEEEELPPGEELEFAADDLEGGSPEEDAEAAADIEVADDEMEPEAEPEADVALEDQTVNVRDLMSAIETALENVIGEPVESSIEDEEAPVDDEEEVDVDDLGVDAADDMEVVDATDAEASDELVEQITKRVAARILKAALKKKSNVDVSEGFLDKAKSMVGLGKPKDDVMQLAKDANRKVSGGLTAEEAAYEVAGDDENLKAEVLRAMKQSATREF